MGSGWWWGGGGYLAFQFNGKANCLNAFRPLCLAKIAFVTSLCPCL